MWRIPVLSFFAGSLLFAQVPNPTQGPTAMPVQARGTMPVFHITVVSRTIKAVNYRHRSGSTKVDFQGTPLLPDAEGKAKVESKMGSTRIETELTKLEPASKFGPEFLTYVLWAITPEGRAQNLGELVLDDGEAKLLSTTELQSFGLMVTAEPYFAVTQPSDVVVVENIMRDDTKGTIEQVDAKYELLQRGSYIINRADYHPVEMDPKGPLQLAEARNAVQIARLAGAETYAPESFQNAMTNLQKAESYAHKKSDRKLQESSAREAAQTAEDARIITVKKREEEQLAQERAAAAAREAQARSDAEAEARRRAQAEMARERAEMDRQRADMERQRAESDRLTAERAKRDAEAAQATALAQQQAAQIDAERARLAADEANRARQQAETERAELRSQLLHQLNLVLETRDTARGLIVNMSDVLFDTGRYTLRPGAREKLAKISGIVLSYPGLTLDVEGHTDSVGADDYNQRLSEQRAEAVRTFLVQQGVPSASVTAEAFGETAPVASNDTAAGRQQNRRVELVVAGEIMVRR